MLKYALLAAVMSNSVGMNCGVNSQTEKRENDIKEAKP